MDIAERGKILAADVNATMTMRRSSRRLHHALAPCLASSFKLELGIRYLRFGIKSIINQSINDKAPCTAPYTYAGLIHPTLYSTRASDKEISSWLAPPACRTAIDSESRSTYDSSCFRPLLVCRWRSEFLCTCI
jgi:hypothetical protein